MASNPREPMKGAKSIRIISMNSAIAIALVSTADVVFVSDDDEDALSTPKPDWAKRLTAKVPPPIEWAVVRLIGPGPESMWSSGEWKFRSLTPVLFSTGSSEASNKGDEQSRKAPASE